jgi:DNA-binding LacI/PurR family transcriptional regulator
VEGVVLMELRTVDERVSFLLDADIPFTTIGRTGGEQVQAYVDADFEAIGSMAVEYVAGLGHTEIGFLARSQADLDAGHGPLVRTRDAVVAAAAARGILAHVFTASPTFNAGWKAFDEIRESAPGLTALLSYNEPAVPGFMAAAAERGLRIPRDLSVVGLNSSEDAAQASHPNLTSLSPNHSDIAKLAVRYLVRSLHGEDHATFQKLLRPELIERGSTSAVPA